MILAAYFYNHDISLDNEEKIINFLERLNLIRAGKVLKRSKYIINSPLSIRAANFINDWGREKLPLFPGLVLATIIDQNKQNLLYYPSVENDQNDPVGSKNPEKMKILPFYMEIFRKFFAEFNDLATEKSRIDKWCQVNCIQAIPFNFLIQQLIASVNFYRKIYNFDLGLYETENVISKAMPILCFNYAEKIYESHDKINHIYHDKEGNTAVLDKKRFRHDYFFYPERFISLYQLNNNYGHDIVLFYIIIED